MSVNETMSQFVKVNNYHDYRLKYGLQYRALAHTEQLAIKGPKND